MSDHPVDERYEEAARVRALEADNERLRGLLQRHHELRGKPASEEWVDGGPTYRLAMQLWRDTAAALAGAANQPDDATDAARYRWLRERINWRDVDESGGAFSLDPLKYQARHWTHSDVRLPSLRPASEHIDEYIDGQLRAADPTGDAPRTFKDAVDYCKDPECKMHPDPTSGEQA